MRAGQLKDVAAWTCCYPAWFVDMTLCKFVIVNPCILFYKEIIEMAKSTWRRNDFICYNKKVKKVQDKKGEYTFGGYVEEHAVLQSASQVYASAITFWTTPQDRRTPQVPPLYLYDPVTLEEQEINYSSQNVNSSHRLYMMIIRPTTNPDNLEKRIWVDSHHWWSNTLLTTIFVYVHNTTLNEYHLYKVSSTDMTNTYGMTPHSQSFQIQDMSSAHVYGVYADATRFRNLLNNSTIQGVLAGSGIYNNFLYFQEDVSDANILNLCKIYEMDGVTQVEPLTI